MANADSYDIKPIGIFGSSISVTKSGVEIANLKMTWQGQIVLSFRAGKEYVLKAKGPFQKNFIIENEEKERLVLLEPKFNWSKFSYNYHIEYEKQSEDALLILLGVYASNYFIAAMSGAM